MRESIGRRRGGESLISLSEEGLVQTGWMCGLAWLLQRWGKVPVAPVGAFDLRRRRVGCEDAMVGEARVPGAKVSSSRADEATGPAVCFARVLEHVYKHQDGRHQLRDTQSSARLFDRR